MSVATGASVATGTRSADEVRTLFARLRPARFRRGRASPWRASGGVASVFLIFLAYSWSFRGRWIDDSYITLGYARNLVENHVWGFLPGRISNTATSPLNVVVEAAFGWAFHSASQGLVFLTAALFTVLTVLLTVLFRRLFQAPLLGVATAALFALNPLLISTIGLESLLFAAILVAALTSFLYGRRNVLAVLVGLAMLTRPDGIIFGLVIAGLLAVTSTGSRQRLVRLSVFFLTVLVVTVPWYWFAWRHLGGFLPDTLLIKRGESRVWQGSSFGDGLFLFAERYPLALIASFMLLPFGGLVLMNRSRPVRLMAVALLVYCLLHYVAYAVLAVPPYHWYYTPEVVVAILLGSFGFATWWQKYRQRRIPAVAALGCLLLVSATAVMRAPAGELPIQTNLGTARDYQMIGSWLNSHTSPSDSILVIGEVGTVGYFSRRTTVNNFTDMNATTALISHSPDLRAGGLMAALIRADIRYRTARPQLPRQTYTLVWGLRPPRSAVVVQAWDVGTRWTPQVKCYLLRG